jgi:hypothetical protein
MQTQSAGAAGQSQRPGTGHAFADGARLDIECAPEDPWKGEGIVDLVGEITAPRGDDCGSRLERLIRPDIRYGIGTGRQLPVSS